MRGAPRLPARFCRCEKTAAWVLHLVARTRKFRRSSASISVEPGGGAALLFGGEPAPRPLPAFSLVGLRFAPVELRSRATAVRPSGLEGWSTCCALGGTATVCDRQPLGSPRGPTRSLAWMHRAKSTVFCAVTRRTLVWASVQERPPNALAVNQNCSRACGGHQWADCEREVRLGSCGCGSTRRGGGGCHGGDRSRPGLRDARPATTHERQCRPLGRGSTRGRSVDHRPAC